MLHRKKLVHLMGHIGYIILYLYLVLLAVLFYNSAGLKVMLYAGWVLLIVGVVILSASAKSRKKGRKAENGFVKETLVDTGVYAYVRHPGYLAHMLIIFSLILMAQYWISIVVGSMLIALLFFAIIEEERRNIEKFGDAYRGYMEIVPMVNLFAGILRRLTDRRGKGN